MTLQFEELNEVDMRSLWPHEAHDFTPWLANHLEHLSQTVGIPMELDGTEVSVGPFSADILARDPSDNRILIETRIPHLAQTSDAVNRQLSCFSSRYMNLLAVFQI